MRYRNSLERRRIAGATSCLIIGWLLAVAPALGQPFPVSEIKLRTDPADARVRPLESLVVQVMVYSANPDGADDSPKIRVQRDGAEVELKDPQGGWLSKGFRYQGEEAEPFYEPEDAGLGSILLGRATSQFVLQDSVLYTAPNQPGKYDIEATLDGKTDRISIRVEANAPSRREPERDPFQGDQRAADSYRKLVEHYAPFVAQETWFEPKSDYLARFDFDGDWRGDNNWENTAVGSSKAYVYYAVMETQSHWFLIYNFFHPRDYSDKCVGGSCHENDNEGLILTIEKDGSALGRLQTMETLAHNNIYSYRADSRIKGRAHNIDGDIELHEGSHPVVFIESGGHGVYGSNGNHTRFDARSGEFGAGTGVTYVYRGQAERPEHPDSRNVGYELVPIYEHWWLRAHGGRERQGHTFTAYYQYQPYGERPRPDYSRIAGSFFGRVHGADKAKPFWGWHDRRTRNKRILATGQWGLDPAYAVSQNLRFPGRVSLDYVFNPFLGIGKPAAPVIGDPPAAPSKPVETTRLTQLPARRSKDYDPDSKQGRFDIRIRVDHVVEVFVQGETIRYRAFGGKPPKDKGSEYSQPIPRGSFRKFALEKKDGRGLIVLLEQPSAANQYTAKLRIEDPQGGEDRYHARLRWDLAESPAPDQQPKPARSRILSKHLEGLIVEEASAEK